MTDISHVDLTTLPSDIWHELSSYLDTGDFVSLAAVNQSLRRTLTSDYPLLSSLLRHRMNLKYSSRSKRTPYEEIVFRIPSRRCDGCGGMESKPSLVKWNAVFQKGLCGDCRRSQKFKMISATKAISEYEINESDLSPLRVAYVANSYVKSRPHTYFYRLVDVQEVSRAKFAAKGTTLEDEKRKEQERREQRRLAAREQRRRHLIRELAAVGLEMHDDDPLMSGFLEHCAANYKPKLKEVVLWAVRRHNSEHHIPLEKMMTHVQRDGNGTIETRRIWGVGMLTTVAEKILEEGEKDWDRSIMGTNGVCKCGRKLYFDVIFSIWCHDFGFSVFEI